MQSVRFWYLSAFLLFVSNCLFGQDATLSVTTYNLLNYRNFTSYCTATNNAPETKELNLKIITQHLNSDVYSFNEVGEIASNADSLLLNVLNTNGVSKYAKVPYSNNGSSLVNAIFYNTQKLIYHSQVAVKKDLQNNNLARELNLSVFYFKDSLLDVTNDTTFVTLISAHLKAGNSAEDAIERGKATTALMHYLNQKDAKENMVFLGDLNVYSSNEESYQDLLVHPNPNITFFDPVSKPGAWNNSAAFADLHTQSTRSSGNSCLSGGGMDDRFDQVLINYYIKNGLKHLTYKSDSYKALGQDGLRFNGSINSPANSIIPSAVATALYNCSDHLPVSVVLEARFPKPSIILNPLASSMNAIGYFLNDQFVLNISIDQPISISFEVINQVGQTLASENLGTLESSAHFEKNLPLSSGIYFIKIATNGQPLRILKVVKN